MLRARPETFRRATLVEPIFAELGVAGVFSAEGAAWRSQRRLAMEALSPKHLRASYGILSLVAERLRRRWERLRARPPVDRRVDAAVANDGRPFSDEVISGNCMTMLLAGEDTTANSLAWAVHLLCDHPGEVAALRSEIDAVLAGATVPDMDQAQRLTGASAVSSESMRLLPVAPVNFMNAVRDTTIGDVEVPAGTGVVALSRIPATDARYFADPERFRPTRWLGEGDGGAHEPGASQPFGSGPRICPGRSLALIEMRLVLGMLYRNFDVTRVGAPSDVKERYSFTVMPSSLQVRLGPRAVS